MTVNIFLFQGRETKIVSEYVRTGQPSAFDTSGMIPPSVLQYNGSSDSGVRSAHWWNDWTAAEIPGERKHSNNDTQIQFVQPNEILYKHIKYWDAISVMYYNNEYTVDTDSLNIFTSVS